MRCLVVADLHYSLPQFDWLLAAAPEFDLVIFAGDALDVGSFVDFRAQILVVKKYLTLLSGVTRVVLCSGNHDLDERSPEVPRLTSIAKARCSDAFVLIGNEAVQMHGGIGMTDEHDIGFFLKRARAAEIAFGDAAYHRNRFAELGGY